MKRNTIQVLLIVLILSGLSFTGIDLSKLRNEKFTIVFGKSTPRMPYGNSYFIDTEIPNLVEGTAKIFDTSTYFERNSLENCYATIHIISNNLSNLKISIGYKSTDVNLLTVPYVIDGITAKEIVLWKRQNNHPTTSLNLSSTQSSSSLNEEINIKYDLKALGFTTDEYVKADERIWYLRINRIDNNSIGEYIEQIVTENGETYTEVDYKPYINYLASFEIQFDNLVFSTLLHPFFDGTSEVIVPIRGVNHELQVLPEQTKQTQLKSLSTNSWEENESHSGPKARWAVVWGCSCDDVDPDEIAVSPVGWVPVESCAFILGCWHGITSLDDWQYCGVYDYGWNVAYCMDSFFYIHPLKTCTIVTDEYFESMMEFVDNKLGANDELIVFTHSHGFDHKDEHYTVTDEGWYQNWLRRYRDLISCDSHYDCASYYDEIGDITDDDTYVFLYAKACQTSKEDPDIEVGIDTFPSDKENDHLLTWSCKYYAMWGGYFNDYIDFYWFDGITEDFRPLSFLFYYSYDGDNLNTISDLIADDDGCFFPKEYWNNYPFKLKIPFTIENFDLFYLLEDNDYISSTHTNNQIEFSYWTGGPSATMLTESYFLGFPTTSEEFYVEITADWNVYQKRPHWDSLLEVGTLDYSTGSFTPFACIGTNDLYSTYYGRFQAMINDNWYYATDLDEVQQSRTNVKYKIFYSYGQYVCRIQQGSTILYTLLHVGYYDPINAIRLHYQHKSYTATYPSTWLIKDIYAEINY